MVAQYRHALIQQVERGRHVLAAGDKIQLEAEFSGGEAVFVDARAKTKLCTQGALFQIGDPIWLWRGEDGWIFGQIAPHGLDPNYSPDDELRPPTWEEMHGGHSPEYFRAGLSDLAARYRAGALTREEHDAAVNRLLGVG